MDVMMPGLDGLDTMRIIRQLDGYQQLPIIAVTAKAMMGDRDKCLEAGATDYVAKPVNMDLLLETLRRMLPQDAH
jgi:two-component system, chemotaxis family, sensor kinase CheA